MANDYNILADYIVSRYIERIAGDDIEETFVDEYNTWNTALLRALIENIDIVASEE